MNGRLRNYSFSAVLVLLFAIGCGDAPEPGPTLETVKVTGQVLDADGQPVPGGTIEFISADDPERSAAAEIENGNFTLQTLYHGTTFDGAAVGTYSVMVIPPQSESQSESPVELPETIDITDEESLTLRLPAVE